MKFTKFLIAIFCLSPNLFFAKTGNIQSILKDISKKIGTVETKNYIYAQKLEWDENRPFSLLFEKIRTDKKGKTVEERFEFNLADFDVNSVRRSNEKDKIIVTLTADNRQKTIQYFKDGTQQNYVSSLEIVAQDALNGDEIEKLIESIIPEGKKLSDAELQLNSFEERKEWLATNIVTFSIDSDRFEQSVETVEDHPSIIRYSSVTEKRKSSVQEVWQFNLADISPQSVQLQVKSKQVYVEMKTRRNLKFIQHWEDDQLSGFGNTLKIFVPEIDHARHLVNVVKKLIPESVDAMKTQAPKPDSQEAALQFLSENIGEVSDNENSHSQEFKPNCLTTFQSKGTEKDKLVEKTLDLNLADLNEKRLSIDVSGKSLFIKTETRNKQALIQVKKDGEIQNYSKEFAIRASDVQNAKSLLNAFEVAIETCRKSLEFEVPEGDASAQFDWLSKNIGAVKVGETDYTQELSMIDENTCQWELKTNITTPKNNTEKVFQFNLSDLDAQKIDFKISKRDLGVYIETRFGEKVIKQYKNGEPDDYQKSFLIHLDSVEMARNVMEGLRRGIAGCGE